MAAAVLVLEVGVRDSTALVPDTESTTLCKKSLQGFALKPQIECSVCVLHNRQPAQIPPTKHYHTALNPKHK
ncbi:hypothetical protein B9Z19DRAFT_1118633 [Tuber borchii]|uniref:Uncharacterized protein n=1 Tax=Tuber borchii TaxID=42251 RepID=A0A2T7A859_TUBBO|nr:hypothetical protein B9Z19DRAFT_1118633 [Tuber borchii]